MAGVRLHKGHPVVTRNAHVENDKRFCGRH